MQTLREMCCLCARTSFCAEMKRFPFARVTLKSQRMLQSTSLSIPSIEKDGKEISEIVRNQLELKNQGRLFAIISLCERQRKITSSDIVLSTDDNMPNPGEKILLRKALMIGGSDFSIVGRPMLSPDSYRIEATVIEKTLSPPILLYWYVPKKHIQRRFLKDVHFTYLRINTVELLSLET